MIIDALYLHEEPGTVNLVRKRQADSDKLFVRFLPEEEESIPFDGTLIPIEQFGEWLAEIDSLYEDLEAAADAMYDDLVGSL